MGDRGGIVAKLLGRRDAGNGHCDVSEANERFFGRRLIAVVQKTERRPFAAFEKGVSGPSIVSLKHLHRIGDRPDGFLDRLPKRSVYIERR